MEILSAYGVPTKIVDTVKILYKDTVPQVITPDSETDLFEVLAGILQGDTLAPSLHYCTRLCDLGSYLEFINQFYVREKTRF